MKKSFIMLASVLLLCLTGCAQEASSVIISDEDIVENEYCQTEGLWDNFEVAESVLDVPDFCRGYFCVYDDKVYYEVNFFDYLTDQTGLVGNKPFEPQYNTEIRVCDMKSGEDRLLYKYMEESCVDITDITCNGEYLVWEDTDKGWNMKCMRLGSEEEPELLFTSEQNEGDFWSVVPKLVEDKLYWYNQKGSSNNSITLYEYSFDTEEIAAAKTGLDLASPYESIGFTDGIYTTYSRTEGTDCCINIYDSRAGRNVVLKPEDTVRAPVSNRNICVWMEGYDGDGQALYVYDLEQELTEKIDVSPGRIFSYAIKDHYIFINQRGDSDWGSNGLYCLDLQEKTYEKLNIPEEKIILFTNQGAGGNIYFELADSTAEVRIVNIK